MQEIVQRILNGEAITGRLGLGVDDDGLHVIFQEDDSETVYEEVIPQMMLAMLAQMAG